MARVKNTIFNVEGTNPKTVLKHIADFEDRVNNVLEDMEIHGVQGPVGPQGPQGPAGPVGPQGEVGLTGATGLQGEKGETGLRGPAGPQGPMGPTGPVGPQGLIGPQGPAGVGLRGLQGEEGPRGPKGDKGDTGPQGVQGPAGPEGERGPRGYQGDVGPAGPSGPSGPAGPQGVQGPAGSGSGAVFTQIYSDDKTQQQTESYDTIDIYFVYYDEIIITVVEPATNVPIVSSVVISKHAYGTIYGFDFMWNGKGYSNWTVGNVNIKVSHIGPEEIRITWDLDDFDAVSVVGVKY